MCSMVRAALGQLLRPEIVFVQVRLLLGAVQLRSLAVEHDGLQLRLQLLPVNVAKKRYFAVCYTRGNASMGAYGSVGI